jgi:hypothetical protein
MPKSNPDFPPMAIEHPFQALFETFGRLPAVHAETVNHQAYEALWDLLSVNPEQAGRCILLRSPRAGHGKTHLLSRLQHHLGAGYEFIPLHAAHGSHIDATTVTADAVARLGRSLPAGGGLTVLDLLVRRLFALALQPLVGSGEVPCQDREGALAALRNRPVETFDFHHPNAVTAHWAKENFEILGPRLAMELSQRTGAPLREVGFWVETLFQFASTSIDQPGRDSVLVQAIATADQSPSQVFERLATLLNLVSQLVRVILVADDLEGFSSDESAALRLASFLGSLRHSADRVDSIVSVNQDIWESAFLPRLSGGLADRLAEVVVELEPLRREDVVALLEARAPGLGARISERIEYPEGDLHARAVLRLAGEAWTSAARQGQPPAEIKPPEALFTGTVTPSKPVSTAAAEQSPVPSIENPFAPQPPHEQSPSTSFGGAFQEGPSAPAQETWNPGPPANGGWPIPTVEEPAEVVTREQGPAFGAADNWQAASPPPPYFPSGSIPVGRIVSEPIDQASATQESPPFGVEASSGFARPAVPEQDHVVRPPVRETPLAEVLAQEAAYDSAPAVPPAAPSAPSNGSPFHPATPVAPPIMDLPRHAEASAAIFGIEATPSSAPVNDGEGVAQAGTSNPPSEQQQAAAPSAAQETDRVDELLRQFRERYAKG